MPETALLFEVPEAEDLVGRFRARYDASAAVGVPAHVTLLYPFLDPAGIGAQEMAALTTLFASQRALDVAFARCARFGEKVLYLAPEPEDALLDLMHRLFERWPECVPYHGTIPADAIRPHLTVTDSIGREHMDRIEVSVAGGLPVRSRLAEAWLYEEKDGRWARRAAFALG